MGTETKPSLIQQIPPNAGNPLPVSPPDATIDITADVCPMTFVRTRLALDRLAPGQTLLVTLRGAEPLRNVPRTAREQGHEVLALEAAPGDETGGEKDGVSRLLLRRGP
jgi:TusA-related sulfurtransferase